MVTIRVNKRFSLRTKIILKTIQLRIWSGDFERLQGHGWTVL